MNIQPLVFQTSDDSLYLGTDNDTNFFQGTMDEVMTLPTPQTSNESIQSLYPYCEKDDPSI